jgi:hypothetical protein
MDKQFPVAGFQFPETWELALTGNWELETGN